MLCITKNYLVLLRNYVKAYTKLCINPKQAKMSQNNPNETNSPKQDLYLIKTTPKQTKTDP